MALDIMELLAFVLIGFCMGAFGKDGSLSEGVGPG
jgi:hypothetical protein